MFDQFTGLIKEGLKRGSTQNEKRLLEMSSVAKNNRIIPAIDKLDN